MAPPPPPPLLSRASLSAVARLAGRWARTELPELWLPSPMPAGALERTRRRRTGNSLLPLWRRWAVGFSPPVLGATCARMAIAYRESWRTRGEALGYFEFLEEEQAWLEERIERTVCVREATQRGLPPPVWEDEHASAPMPTWEAFLARREQERERERDEEQADEAAAAGVAEAAAQGREDAEGAREGARQAAEAATSPLRRLAAVPPGAYAEAVRAFVEGYREGIRGDGDDDNQNVEEGKRAEEGEEGGGDAREARGRMAPKETPRQRARREAAEAAERAWRQLHTLRGYEDSLPVPSNYDADWVPKRDEWLAHQRAQKEAARQEEATGS